MCEYVDDHKEMYMLSKDLQALVKEKIQADHIIGHAPIETKLTTVSIEINGVIRIVDVVAIEVGTFEGIEIE